MPGVGFLPIEHIIHGYGESPEQEIVADPEANEVVQPVVGMGVWTNDHAAPAVGPCLAPEGIAAF